MKTNLKIGAYTWNYNDEITDMKDFGSCDYESLMIKIRKGLQKDIKQCTIIHELLHAFIEASGIKIEEKEEENIVDMLANQTLLFIKNNSNFLKSYILKLK